MEVLQHYHHHYRHQILTYSYQALNLNEMDTSTEPVAISYEEQVLKAKVAQICEHVGFSVITQGSYNLLVDIYRHLILNIARHCKEFANHNRRVEPTFLDLIQAYNHVGISIPKLQEHAEQVRLPPNLEIKWDSGVESELVNGINRTMYIDDLLDAEKNAQNGIKNDDGASEHGSDDDEKPTMPSFKDTYQEITSKFSDIVPVKADKKIRLGGRILLVSNTKLKIAPPLPPETKPSEKKKRESPKEKKASKKKSKKSIVPLDPLVAEAPSFLPILEPKQEMPVIIEATQKTPSPSPSKAAKESKKRKSKSAPTTKKKVKTTIAPIDPAIAEPPSFLPIIESKPPEMIEPPMAIQENPRVSPMPSKQANKGKKKKAATSQFAIVTETVTEPDGNAPEEVEEYICPTCNLSDDGDWVACDSCSTWYHIKCEGLKKAAAEQTTWNCKPCVSKKKSHKKSQSAAASIKMKTPEPPKASPPLPPPPSQDEIATTSVDDENCPECHQPDDGSTMIQCDHPDCSKWYHIVCVGIAEAPSESWFCKHCVERQQSAFGRRRRAK